MKLSIVIPARNEEGALTETVHSVTSALAAQGVDYEVIVVDDASTDGTADIAARLSEQDPRVHVMRSPYRNGFGFAVRAGLEAYTGDAVAIMMADGSDDPADLLTYYRLLAAGYDCAFGSRFMAGSQVYEYPRIKRIVNRIVNQSIRLLFGHGCNDTTNAFKAYRREVIDGVAPLVSHHFNLTVKIPLKAVVRGHSYAIVPISWRNRRTGTSKLRLSEMGSRYLFIVLYAFFEHHLSRGDYRRAQPPGAPPRRGWRAGAPGLVVREEQG